MVRPVRPPLPSLATLIALSLIALSHVCLWEAGDSLLPIRFHQASLSHSTTQDTEVLTLGSYPRVTQPGNPEL